MSDGIHDGYKTSDETEIQDSIAKAILSLLENPTSKARRFILESTIRQELHHSNKVLETVTRLENNDSEEWLRFFNSSAFGWQNDQFKNSFLTLAKNRNIAGF
jgi:hypothetical protein